MAQSTAKVLGATSRKDCYFEGNNYIVLWCVGHLAGLADASFYDEHYAKWRYDNLSIVLEEWLFEVSKDKAQQFKVLRDLKKDMRVTGLVCATDAGREAVNVKQVAPFFYFLQKDKQKNFHLGLDANLSHFFEKKGSYNLASLKIIKSYLRRLAWT